MRKYQFGFLILALSAFLAGCATVISGTNQTLTFQTEPEGAAVYLDGQMIGRTPVSVTVKKNEKQTLMVRKEGYETITRDITKSFDNVAILNVFWDLSTTDLITGALYEYAPNSYFIQLDKNAE